DGTEAGTRRVRDIRRGPDDAFLIPYDQFSGFWTQLTVVNHTLYFVASDGQTGFELWRSDGTAVGTRPVGDLVPGTEGLFDCAAEGPCQPGWPDLDFAAVGDTLFFTVGQPATDDSGVRTQLWRSDGTAAGTAMIEDDVYPAIAAHDDRVYFTRSDPDQQTTRLWSRDATASQSPIVAELPNYTALRLGAPLGLVMVNEEPWWSDGTAAGTYLLKDIRGDDASAFPLPLADLGGTLLLTAEDGVHGRELWRSDGTAAGTSLVADINPGPAASDPEEPFPIDGALLFVADDGVHGRELWRSDGTAAGTTLVADINPGAGHSAAEHFQRLGSAILFFADDGVHGRELWTTDGTTAGTQLVRDLRSGLDDGAPDWWSAQAAVTSSDFYFVGDDGVHGRELWRSDGTAAQTALVADLASGDADSAPSGLATFAADVWFTTTPEIHADGSELVPLWRSDGTAVGTTRVGDLPAEYDQFLASGDSAFLSAWDGSGRGLWRIDGRRGIPVKVDDNVPYEIVDAGGALFGIRDFGALWRYAYGTLAWFRDGHGLTAFGRHTVFMEDSFYAQTIWTSGGLEETTMPLQQLPPAKDYVDYDCKEPHFTRAGDLVYFAADAGDLGCELWALPVDALAEACIEDCPPPQATPTPTVVAETPSPAPACLAAGDAGACTQVIAAAVSGARAETVAVELRLAAHDAPIAGIQADLTFGRDVPVAATPDGRPVCVVNRDIDKPSTAFAFQPTGCRPGRDCTAVRALVLALDNVDPIPDGSLLYTCQVAIDRRAARGNHRLRLVNLAASDPEGRPIAASGVDGSVTVLDSGVFGSGSGGKAGCQVVAPTTDPWALFGLFVVLVGAARRRRF
ncbi:MAG TPA: ELWxxDGT repeat protein, partial [Candidatus Dormibacteraeota bacterium]|nr:ELWxxDGT repeat protein [Candidatus Dormibacteraeota bacterium]